MGKTEYLVGEVETADIVKENGLLRLRVGMLTDRIERMQRALHDGHNMVTDWHDCLTISCVTTRELVKLVGKPSLNTPKPKP